MKDNNTLSKREYASEHVFWSAIAMIWYRAFLFRCIEGMSYSFSRIVLWGIFLAAVLLGVLITWRHRRNNLNLFVNIAVPFEIYTLIAYANILPILMWIIVFTAVLLSGLYTFMLMAHQIKNQAHKRAIIRKRIIRSSLGSRTIIACCFSLLILYLGANTVFGGFISSPSVAAESKNTQDGITIANNIEVISQLDESIWSSLPPPERLNTLQTVANIEAYYLGLPHELTVVTDDLSGSTLACYEDRTHVITIDVDHFNSDSASAAVSSICHEARHALQHRLCDLYDDVDVEYKSLLIFSDVQHYKQEFSDYVNGEDDILDYYLQRCEVDARAYARDAVADYYEKISAYSGKGEA